MTTMREKMADQLLTATERKDWKTVAGVLKMGIDPDLSKVQKSFKLAASKGRADIVAMFLENGLDVHYSDDKALRWSAKNGHIDVVRALIDHGADVSAREHEALRNAAQRGQEDIVALLLDHGADATAANSDALLRGARRGAAGSVKRILDAGADIHALGDKALRLAARQGHAETVKLLLERGADVFAENTEALTLARQSRSAETREIVEDWINGIARDRAAEKFEDIFGDTVTMDGLRKTIDADGTTGLMLAAQAGLFDTIAQTLRAARGGLTAEDVLKRNDAGASVVGTLRQRGELKELFRPEFWAGRRQELDRLWGSFSQFDMPRDVDIDGVRECVNILTIRRTPGKKLAR